MAKEWGTLKIMLGRGLINSKIRFLKSLEEGEEWIFDSNLFLSTVSLMMDGKKSVSKEAVVGFNGRQVFRVTKEYAVDGFGIRC